ncbi:MAG: hypothetical protein K2G49_00320 [Muribaculum sp.]|nr:hypothetical protein [Muribaculum sp.]
MENLLCIGWTAGELPLAPTLPVQMFVTWRRAVGRPDIQIQREGVQNSGHPLFVNIVSGD